MIYTRRILVVALVPLCLSACASAGFRQLNDPKKSVELPDVANLLKPRKIPYETKTVGNFSVSYSLGYINGDSYRLTLILRNNSGVSQTVTPTVTLRDATGLVVPPYDYGTFLIDAAMMAGEQVPSVQLAESPTYYSSGTIQNITSGNTYTYSGTTTTGGGFAGGFAQGFANGAAVGAMIRAQREREAGRLMLQWAQEFWLKKSYEIPPNSGVSGALFFPASTLGPMPMHVTVQIGSEKVDFTTISG